MNITHIIFTQGVKKQKLPASMFLHSLPGVFYFNRLLRYSLPVRRLHPQ